MDARENIFMMNPTLELLEVYIALATQEISLPKILMEMLSIEMAENRIAFKFMLDGQ